MRAAPVTVEAARALILEHSRRLEVETVSGADCLGRVAAEDVTAEEAVPPFDNSAMDGYAVRSGDLAGAGEGRPVVLKVVGESRAGRPATAVVAENQAIAISTGAVVPEGADAVVPVEDAVAAGQGIEVRTSVEGGRFVRRRGDDVRPGDRVIAAGTRMGPAEVGSLASVGRTAVTCARRPTLAVLTTGDELVEPGQPLRHGQIRNASARSIPALAGQVGCDVGHVANVPDDAEATGAALSRCLDSDIVVVCGGVSVGPHDHVKGALESLGVEQIFWRVALRPGRPTWFGRARPAAGAERGPLVFGLPGNPVSAMVTFQLFVTVAVASMQGADPRPRTLRARFCADYEKPAARAEYVRCRLEAGEDAPLARPTATDQSSHVLTSMIGADCLAVLPVGCERIEAGDTVTVELLGPR